MVNIGDNLESSYLIPMTKGNHVLSNLCRFGWNKIRFSDDDAWSAKHIKIRPCIIYLPIQII